MVNGNEHIQKVMQAMIMLNIIELAFTDLYLIQVPLLDLSNSMMEEQFKLVILMLVPMMDIVICEITLHQLGQIKEMLQSQLADILLI